MTYRDRQGQQIELTEWAALRNDIAYRLVAEDQADGVIVRTVWEGIDDVPGAMFATGTSRDGGESWQSMRTDARTEPDALVQHHEAVEGVFQGSTSSLS
ncbi:hypothetical protein [Streptomyces sp. 6N106]|uniref:hypothetical protein n=1 Tax=Streptomyces sp. 6N106 TaxID=3457418 RepID=UPI003FD16DDD